MTPYKVSIKTSAQKQFKKLPTTIQDKIAPKMLALTSKPRPHGSQKLRGSDFYRIRIGNYRLIYSIDDKHKSLSILDIAHRKDVYR